MKSRSYPSSIALTRDEAFSARRRRLLLAFGLLGIAGAAPRWARAQAAQELHEEAAILVAAPDFDDPHWHHSVLFALPVGNDMHAGLILNRPTRRTLAELFPEHEPSKQVTDPVFYGGPASLRSIYALVRSESSPGTGALPIGRDFYWATGEQAVDSVIEEHPTDSRFYAGHVVWRPGELRMELEKELWSPRPFDPKALIPRNALGLWKDLSGQRLASASFTQRFLARA